MDRERIKTWVLVGLVLLSFVFTTQLWLSVPLERIISTKRPSSGQDSMIDYDLSSFVLPRWFVVNFGGGSHTKLLSHSASKEYFTDICREAYRIMEYIFKNGEETEFITAEMQELSFAKERKSIEIGYDGTFDKALFGEVFGDQRYGESFPFDGIKKITISLGETREVFIDDGNDQGVYKTVVPSVDRQLDDLMKELEKSDPVKYWTLGEIGYSDNDNFYVPLDMSSFNLPVGTAEKEIDVNDQQVVDMHASDFFDDMSLVRKITEMDGSLIYTDSQSALLRINADGSLEYLAYSYAGGEGGDTDINSAANIAIRFIDEHGGIPEQLFLEEIRRITENGREGYLFRFNYAYNGLPFYQKGALSDSAVEITVMDGKVVKYYRNIHHMTRARIMQMPLLYPVEAADVVAKRIRALENTKVPLDILDMRMGYCIDTHQKNDYQVFPVWYIKTEQKEFIVDAYKGVLAE